jgi:hypothetical protein
MRLLVLSMTRKSKTQTKIERDLICHSHAQIDTF